jgi:hypothetical protein
MGSRVHSMCSGVTSILLTRTCKFYLTRPRICWTELLTFSTCACALEHSINMKGGLKIQKSV